jgi:hypothetical protein
MAESKPYTVNEVVVALDSLDGKTIDVSGVLELEFEGDSLSHLPKSERKPGHESSLWAVFDYDALGRSLGQLHEFDGRHVVVTAEVDRQFTGHMGLWPGALRIRDIAKARAGDA